MIWELRHDHKITLLLKAAKMKRSSYYYHLRKAKQEDKHRRLKKEIAAIFYENRGRYGYRRIVLELNNRGMHANHKTVQRLMKELKLKCKVRMKRYHSFLGEVGKIVPNLLKRDFTTTAPNQKWATDVTEFKLYDQKLYLSAIIDLHSSDIICYEISKHPNLRLVLDMLEKIPELPKGARPILHSDQGWQYQHREYHAKLKELAITPSMSRKGNCLDNAVIENFWGLLKTELFYLDSFDSMEDFHRELEAYLDYYNHRRIKAKLGGLAPAVHRKAALAA